MTSVQNEHSEAEAEGEQEFSDDSLNSDKSQPSLDERTKVDNVSPYWNKNSLILLMIIALVLIAVSVTTVSLFSDQHDWNTGRDCVDCHQAIQDELDDSSLSSTGIAIHSTLTCLDCHKNATLNFTEGHIGTMEECEACHLSSASKDAFPNGTLELNLTTESHKALYENASFDPTMPGANEACIACHAGFDLEIQWLRPLNYSYTFTDPPGSNKYVLSNFQANGQRILNYNAVLPGRTHTFATGVDIACGSATTGCHQDIYDAINDGSDAGHFIESTGYTASNPHTATASCSFCHQNSTQIADNEYHASKRITCAYDGAGCHDAIVGGAMDEAFLEIITEVPHNAQGDVCMACHAWPSTGALPTGAGDYITFTEEPVVVNFDGVQVYP